MSSKKNRKDPKAAHVVEDKNKLRIDDSTSSNEDGDDEEAKNSWKKREIVNNWSKYNEIEINENDEEIGSNFNQLFQLSSKLVFARSSHILKY